MKKVDRARTRLLLRVKNKVSLDLGLPTEGVKIRHIAKAIWQKAGSVGLPPTKNQARDLIIEYWFTQMHVTGANQTQTNPENFYRSGAWLELRYQALQINGAACQCCGATATDSGRSLHVDHVKPRSKFPRLQLELSNLQILCHDCNMGKGAWDQTDWRPTPEVPLEEPAMSHMKDMRGLH